MCHPRTRQDEVKKKKEIVYETLLRAQILKAKLDVIVQE